MSADTTKLLVYKLGEGYPSTNEGKPLYAWPYTLYYAPDYPGGPFYLGAGDARNGNGTFLSAVEALRPEWREDLRIAEGEWLLPLLQRLAEGEDVACSEVLEAYRQVHGKAPSREEWVLR
jgi:hypothetical protein